jgi:molybdopterin-guanine dinucleotide biosynthesis protein
VKKPHAIAVVGNSGAGKTTLPEGLIPALKRKGVLVGVASDEPLDLNDPEAIARFIVSFLSLRHQT